MKILLASDGGFVLKYGYQALDIPKRDVRLGYVTTASKGESDRSFVERHKQKMIDEGYGFEEIDIEGKSRSELINFFKDKNIIHVEGGNTFYLLKVIRETGFDSLLKQFLSNGKAYIGTSAGAYIMCPTVEVANWNETGRERFDVTDFTALNYVPFALKVHYRDEMEEFVREKAKTLKYPLRILRDGQGILIDGDATKFIGDGEVVSVASLSNG